MGTNDGACVALGGLGACSSSVKLGAQRLVLQPLLYPNATSLTKAPGGSNTSIRHDTHQSSQGVSVTVANLVHVEPDEVGIL